MSRLTLRLPDTLHQQLTKQAGQEGISLNQYIVYALTRQATLAYTVHPVSDTDQQRAGFAALLERLGSASYDSVRTALDERETASPESDLDPEAAARLRRQLAADGP